jgi:CDP-diacylglycerol--serine O-phosphatidyltransferase
MVSTLRYQSFKDFDLRRRRSYITVLGIALLFLLVALHPEWVLLGGATAFALSGPAAYAFGSLRRRGEPAAEAAEPRA